MFQKGIKVEYITYLWSEGKKFNFELRLSEKISVVGEGYETREERDLASDRVCQELGLIKTN